MVPARTRLTVPSSASVSRAGPEVCVTAVGFVVSYMFTHAQRHIKLIAVHDMLLTLLFSTRLTSTSFKLGNIFS